MTSSQHRPARGSALDTLYAVLRIVGANPSNHTPMRCLLVVQRGGGEHNQLFLSGLFCQAFCQISRSFIINNHLWLVSTYWDVAGVVGLLLGRTGNLALGES